MMPLLRLEAVHARYGPIRVLHGISLEVSQGEIVALLGANSAGKTTTIKTICGLLKPASGVVSFRDEPIDRLPTDQIIRRGIALVPEGRRIFPRMTVLENLEMGAYYRSERVAIAASLNRVLTLFPQLGDRRAQLAGTLSGGEQQMLAIGRALMAEPTLLCLDEPSMGLSPILVERVFDTILEINRQDVSIFIVEQNAQMALEIADRAYVLETGHLVLSGTAEDLLENDLVRQAYLGA